MSLNWSVNPNLARQLKFSTNVSQENLDGSVIDLQLPSVGLNNQVLSSNGDGTIKWANGGGGGITNPLTQTLYPATTTIDLGKSDAPFRTLYVSNQTINLVNSADPLKSGSISVNDGNLDIKTNLATGNVNLGYLAGINSGENSTNIGNGTGNDSGDNCVNLGFQAGKDDCKNNSINIGNGAGIQNSGENSIHIGTLAGSTILGGINGDSSIAIGQSAGQNNIADNSIILNATGLVLDNLIQDAFIVKPVRDQPTYTKILAYDTSSGEIFSSDEKNTLNPVLIATPQVEKNVETKDDNTNALVVLQPTIGDTELLGGEIRVNNIGKTNTAKLKNDLLEIKDSSSRNYQNSFSIEISDEKVANLKTTITKTELNIIADAIVESTLDASNLHFVAVNGDAIFGYDGLVFAEPLILIPRMELVPDFLKFTTADTKYISEYNTKFLSITTNNTILDLPYMKLEADLVGGIQNTITTYKDFVINVAGNQRALVDVDKLEFKDPTGLITSNYGRTLSNIINTNNGNRQTASSIEMSDEKTPTIKSTLTKNSLTITDNSIANSLSNTQLSMIDSLLNRSLLTRTALQLFAPVSTTIPTASLNQTSLVLRTTSLTPEISTLTNNDLILTSPINACVASFSSSTLAMNDLAITHGTTMNKNDFSAIDATQNIGTFNATSLKLFLSTDLLNPATLLNNTKLEIKDATDRTTINTTEVKVLNTTTGNTCSLTSAGLTGNTIDIIPTAGTDISLTISAGGHIFLNGLPTSNVGLPTGALYIHTAGGHNNICSAP